MPDSAAVATASERPGRGRLALLGVPIVILVVMNNLGTALTTEWAERHPLWLIALNSQNRTLILTTNQLDAWSYYLVGSIRLLVADPFFFLIGHWYGDTAIRWLEGRTKTFGEMIRQWEGVFRKAAYPIIFIAPNNPLCLLAGATGMSVKGFFITNVAGTITRLYLIRRVGETFEEPLDDVLGFIRDYSTPFLIGSIALAAFLLFAELRGGGAGLEELEEMVEAEEAGDTGPAGQAAPQSTEET
jgi:membrane protein DedA with SNARE-associated domain